MKPLFEGQPKQLVSVPNDQLVQRFDDSERGRLNNRISSLLFRALLAGDVPCHFVQWVDEQDMLIQNIKMIPLEFVIRNEIDSWLAKWNGLTEGAPLDDPIIEIYLKSDEPNAPMLNRYHIQALDLMTAVHLIECERIALEVNRMIGDLFHSIGVRTIVIKIEFGQTDDGGLLLADEISPDTCILGAAESDWKLDEKSFHPGSVGPQISPREIYKRLRFKYPEYDAETSI